MNVVQVHRRSSMASNLGWGVAVFGVGFLVVVYNAKIGRDDGYEQV